MTSDARITSSSDGAESQNSEPNSLREVLLFCTVLLVEVYSLAVSFGGPFFEVGYFLLVVVSQTFAGAYIWAQLRRTDETLPLPELLAMGFAIGSASAAISQLIVRDLLGIRLFISPLIPIIGVAIWLVAKRDARLPVQVTHATTNTLLWLLFPAPLALSFFSWELYSLFVIPLLIFVILIIKFDLKICAAILIIIAVLSPIFQILTEMISGTKLGLSLVENDIFYDEGHAIGFANWGINENIGQIGSPFSYYKMSHLWLGPVLEIIKASPLLISTTVMNLFIFSIIGSALWTISFRIFASTKAANLASVFVFIQHSLPEPFNLNLRLAQSLVLIFLLCGITSLLIPWKYEIQELLIASIVLSVIISTRTQFGLVLLLGYAIHQLSLLILQKITRRKFMMLAIAVSCSIFCSFLIFLTTASPSSNTDVPTTRLRLAGLLFGAIIVRVIIPMSAIGKADVYRIRLLLATSLSSIILFFLFSQSVLGDAPTIAIVLLASIVISNTFVESTRFVQKQHLIIHIISGALGGFILRIIYDIYKWEDKINWEDADTRAKIVFLLAKTSTSSDFIILLSLVPFFIIYFLSIIFTSKIRKFLNLRVLALMTAVGMSLGISVATTYRVITNQLRYEIKISSIREEDSAIKWLVDQELIEATSWFKSNTAIDAIFAQNLSQPDSEFSASLVLSTITHRRAYIEAPKFGSVNSDDKIKRLKTSLDFVVAPTTSILENLKQQNVKWFIVKLSNTPMRNWEPFAKTRFINDKVAILELNYPIDDNS